MRSTEALPGHKPAAPAGNRQRREEGGSSSSNFPKAYGNTSSFYLSVLWNWFCFFPSCVLREKKLLLSPPPHSPLKESGPIKPRFQSFYHFGAGWGAQCTQVFLQPFPPTPRKYAPPHPLNGVVRGPLVYSETFCKLLTILPLLAQKATFKLWTKKRKCPRA